MVPAVACFIIFFEIPSPLACYETSRMSEIYAHAKTVTSPSICSTKNVEIKNAVAFAAEFHLHDASEKIISGELIKKQVHFFLTYHESITKNAFPWRAKHNRRACTQIILEFVILIFNMSSTELHMFLKIFFAC